MRRTRFRIRQALKDYLRHAVEQEKEERRQLHLDMRAGLRPDGASLLFPRGDTGLSQSEIARRSIDEMLRKRWSPNEARGYMKTERGALDGIMTTPLIGSGHSHDDDPSTVVLIPLPGHSVGHAYSAVTTGASRSATE